MKYKYSIIIPVYNGDKYIDEAILSAINQNYNDFEILIFDDGSIDSTKKIINKYLSRDNVKYIYNENGPSGFVKSWNTAINHSSGEFLTILHQDDILYPDFLQTIDNLVCDNINIKHFFTLSDVIDSENNILVNAEKEIINYFNIGSIFILDHIEYMLLYQKSYGKMLHIHRCPGVVTHKSIFIENNCWYKTEAGHIADDDFFYRVGEYTNVVGILSKLAAFRVHNKSETGSQSYEILMNKLYNDYLEPTKNMCFSPACDKSAIVQLI